MARRYFRCTFCSHRLRFNTARCSVCGAGTPILNRPGLIVSLALGGMLALFGVALTLT